MDGEHQYACILSILQKRWTQCTQSLKTILKRYGIPDKIIRTVIGIYEGFECAVIEENETSELFQIKTDVKQGCVMSGFLFLLAIDWVLKKTTAGVRRGIRWDFTTTLDYLDFADDIVLISSKFQDLSEKTRKIIHEAARVGYKVEWEEMKDIEDGVHQE